MKGWAFDLPGEGDPITLRDMPSPVPGLGEVRIKVAFCGINPVDRLLIRGIYPVQPLPHTPGSEVSGVIDAVGEGVSGFEPGQPVAVAFKTFCGNCRYCQVGDESVCLTGSIVGARTQGGYAEEMVVPAASLVPLPPGVPLDHAAAVILSTCTAWHMMIERARVRAGETVVVFAASGSVGAAAVQIAVMAGAYVVAVVGPGKKEFGRSLGAHVVVERDASHGVYGILQALPLGADVVCNPIGAGLWAPSLEVLAICGRWTTCGVLTGAEVPLELRTFYNRQWSFIGSTGATRADLRRVLDAVERNAIRPTIADVYDLERADAALASLDDPSRTGKVLLRCS